MSAIQYTAIDRGDLVSGHTENTVYTFDVPLKSFNRSIKRKQNTATSLSGRRLTTLHHIKNTYKLQTAPVNDSAVLASMREFMTSVMAGEQFSIDVYGSVAVPNSFSEFVLISDVSETLVDIAGFYSYSMTVEAI